MVLRDNPLIDLFVQNELIDTNNLKLYHSGTRDNDIINVLIDRESGCLILDKCLDNLNKYYFENKNYSEDGHFTLIDQKYIETHPLEDDFLRYEIYKKSIYNSSILDFGCGKGGFLSLLKENNISNNLIGLELNEVNNKNINAKGIPCLFDLKNSNSKFDFIFLNHVFEHLPNPLELLNDLITRLNPDGKLIIEVPHGNDFLIKKSGLDSFKKFTFWSEHLCLYTEEIIKNIFKKMSISDYYVSYKQRYNLNNHVNWFKKGEPGGHKKTIYSGSILNAYNNYLVSNKETDTLIIVIGRGSTEFSKNIFRN